MGKINFLAGPHEWKKFERNNKIIVLNILYVPYNTKEICRIYKSKYNNEGKNQAILLMISECIDELKKDIILIKK